MRTLSVIVISVICLTGFAFGQGTSYVIAAEGTIVFPIGEFAKRLNQTNGFSFSVREHHYNNPRWGVFLVYDKFDVENKDKLFIKRKDTLNNVPRDLVIPLKSFDMSFTSYGAGFSANYNIVSTSLFELNGSAGFGVYYWKFDRDSYSDSVKVDTGSVTPKLKLIDVIQVPALHQQDWSGGVDIGFESELNLFSPFIISTGVRYRVILAELWPTLALDLDNVSGIQSVQFSVGLKYLIE